MARKHGITKQILTGGDMSSDITTSVVDVDGLDSAVFIVAWDTGASLSGEFDVEASVDGTTFVELDITDVTGATPQPTGATGNFVLLVEFATFKQLRVKYSSTAGSGNLNVSYRGESRGA